jgi:hypothetical protein
MSLLSRASVPRALVGSRDEAFPETVSSSGFHTFEMDSHPGQETRGT